MKYLKRIDNFITEGKTTKQKVVCPDCEQPVKFQHEINTDRYGRLSYYTCKNCKERFVSRDGGELEIAAPH